MAAAGGKKEHGMGHGETVEGAGDAIPALASGNGASADAGHSPAQQLIEDLRRTQEEIAGMDKAQVLALEERLRALRLRLLQRIKEEKEKAAAAEKAPAPELRRAG